MSAAHVMARDPHPLAAAPHPFAVDPDEAAAELVTLEPHIRTVVAIAVVHDLDATRRDARMNVDIHAAVRAVVIMVAVAVAVAIAIVIMVAIAIAPVIRRRDAS